MTNDQYLLITLSVSTWILIPLMDRSLRRAIVNLICNSLQLIPISLIFHSFLKILLLLLFSKTLIGINACLDICILYFNFVKTFVSHSYLHLFEIPLDTFSPYSVPIQNKPALEAQSLRWCETPVLAVSGLSPICSVFFFFKVQNNL